MPPSVGNPNMYAVNKMKVPLRHRFEFHYIKLSDRLAREGVACQQDAEVQVSITKSTPRRMFSQNSSLPSRTPLRKRTNARLQGSDVAEGKQSKDKGACAGRSVAVLDKENGASSFQQISSQQHSLSSLNETTPLHSTTACPTQQQLQQGTSLRQAVRKSLRRQTKSPGSSTAATTAQLKQHPASLRPSRIPTPATTPRSLLSSEMKLASASTTHSQNGATFHDEDDELLLCSPAPRRILGQSRVVVRASLAVSPIQSLHSRAKVARKNNTAEVSLHGKPPCVGSAAAKENVVNASATDTSFLPQESTKPIKPKPGLSFAKISSLPKTAFTDEKVRSQSTTLKAPLDAKPAPLMQTNSTLTKIMSSDAKDPTVQVASGSGAASSQRQLLTQKPPQTIPKPPKLTISAEHAADLSTHQAPLMSTRSQWSQGLSASAFRDAQHQQEQQTPFTPAVPKNFSNNSSSKKTGVCMDLTDMFCNAAASSSGNGLIRPPPFVARQKETPMSAISVDNRTAAAPTGASCAPETDDWAEKQCESITKWLNYTFHPTEDRDTSDDETRNNDHQGSETRPKEERLALRTLVLHQRQAQARLKAYQVFHSDKMQSIRNVILSEIQRGRISVRQDRDMYADLTMRRQIVQLLFSYSTPWLRLGLETLFGEIILPEEAIQQKSSSPPLSAKHKNKKSGMKPLSQMKLALKNFIIQRVLSDEKVLEKYTGGLCKVPSGSFEKKYRAELRTLVLYRLLVLFFFLDRAKQENVLDRAPQLFTKDSVVKSSRDVLLAFCRDFLSGEGDFVKHLNRVGLKVFYRQEPVDELDFAVTNLAVDLRDGVRLGRLTEILTNLPCNAILSSLRLPAVSRLQKLHNVNAVLNHLKEFGVSIPGDISAHHVVDGHRERVLKLMWSVIAHCCLKDLISFACVEEEIERILTLGKRARFVPPSYRGKNEACDDEPYDPEAFKSLLLRWADAVCRSFGVHVKDLSSSFADGRAVCYLIHYYHPNLLRLDEMKTATSTRKQVEPISDYQIKSDQANAKLANKRMSELGGIPEMIPICDRQSPPDEKTMVLCLAFLCSRLLESDSEVRSCVVIQTWYRLCREKKLWKRKLDAGRILLQAWRANRDTYFCSIVRRYSPSIAVIEDFVLKHKPALQRLKVARRARKVQYEGAVVIQSTVRGFLARMNYYRSLIRHLSAIRLQSFWRMTQAHRTFQLLRRHMFAAIMIQRAWRYSQRMKNVRYEAAVCLQSFWRKVRALRELRFQIAAIIIQRFWRYTRNRFVTKYWAAVQIQRIWRGFWEQLRLQIDLLDIVTVQSCVRRFLASLMAKERLSAVRTLQSFAREILKTCRQKRKEEMARQRLKKEFIRKIRLFQEKRLILKRETSATTIQSKWRGYLVKQKVLAFFSKIVTCQKVARAWLAGRSADRRKVAILTIQSVARVWLSRKTFIALLAQLVHERTINAVLTMQCAARKWLSGKRFKELKEIQLRSEFAAVSVQCWWRKRCATRSFVCAKNAILTIQRMIRYQLAKNEARTRRTAIVCLQQLCRIYFAQRKLQFLIHIREENHRTQKEGATVIQKRFRGYIVRRELCSLHFFATQIQKVFHGYMARIYFELDLMDIELVQSLARVWLSRRVAERRLECVLKIQACARGWLSRRVSKTRMACALKLQTYSRMWLSQRLANKKIVSIIRIQAFSRMSRAIKERQSISQKMIILQRACRVWLAKRSTANRMMSIIRLQACLRRFLAMNKFRYLQNQALLAEIEEDAALLIQFTWAQFIARKEEQQEMAARLIQKTWRCYTVHIDYLLTVNAAISIQQAWRSFMAQESFQQMVAARTIQKTWRCYTVHIDYLLSVLAAIEIQAFVRRVIAENEMRLRRNAVFILQKYARETIHRRATTTGSSFSKLRLGFTRLQSAYRGRSVRQNAGTSLKACLVSVRKANARAIVEPKLRLCHRTQAALHVLQTSRSLSEIMNAVSVLEMATRLSEGCCAAFADAKAPDILFSLIRTCNRSLPHIELLHFILLTLTNVGQYDSLLPSMATAGGVEVFLDLVQMFRDKEAIFCLAVSLLERVVRSNVDFLVLCGSHENLKRLKGVLALCVRKLSISGPTHPRRESLASRRLSSISGRPSFASTVRGSSTRKAKQGIAKEPSLKQGSRVLRRVIHLVDPNPAEH